MNAFYIFREPRRRSFPFALLVFCIAGALSLQAAPGDLDTTFNGTGVVQSSIAPSGSTPTSMVIQSDGNIVTAGYVGNQDGFAVARYHSDGSLDTTFNHVGFQLPAIINYYRGISATGAAIFGVGLQNAGSSPKIVVAGYSALEPPGDTLFHTFVLMRLNANDGTVDTTFGQGGQAQVGYTAAQNASYRFYNANAYALAVQSDGKLVAAGNAQNVNQELSTGFAVARFNTDGSLDTTFHGSGTVLLDVSGQGFNNSASAVVVQQDGKIIVGGINDSTGSSPQVFALVRFNTDGTQDATFGANGIVTSDLQPGATNDNNYLKALALQTDGKIVALGIASNYNGRSFAVVRYNTDGSLDTTFGSGGKVFTAASNQSYPNDAGFAVAVQADGKLVLCGDTGAPTVPVDGAYTNPTVIRLNTDGSLDTTFGGMGQVIIGTPGSGLNGTTLNGVAVQSDGNIVSVGGGNGFNTLVRLQGLSPTLAPAVSVAPVSGLGGSEATLNGTINPQGYPTTAQFNYGLTTSYGSSATINLSPTNSSTAQTVSASLSGLQAGATYHYQLTATNAIGTSATTDATFTPLGVVTPTFATPSSIPLTLNGFTATGNSLGTITFDFAPVPGALYTLVSNTSSTPISGFFNNLIQGGLVAVTYGDSTYYFTIQYSDQAITLSQPAYSWQNLAGRPQTTGSTEGIGNSALFNLPIGIAADSAGSIYVADTSNETIRKITAAGVTSTLAGAAGQAGAVDASGGSARFSSPQGLAVDSGGNVYVADTNNHAIRKITPAGSVSTLAGHLGNAGTADGTGALAYFFQPTGVVIDSGGTLYVADSGNSTIRQVTGSGVVTTLAGTARQPGYTDATGSAAAFNFPTSVACAGGKVYVADNGNQAIRQIATGGVVTTFAGGSFGSNDGAGAAGQFYYPYGLTADAYGNLFVADESNGTIRRINSSGVVTTIGGVAQQFGSSDGVGGAARFVLPQGIAISPIGLLYVADTGNDRISVGTPLGSTGTAPSAITLAASNLTSTSAVLNGTLYANGASTTVSFDFGTSSSYSAGYAATPSPVTSANATAVAAVVTGLTPLTTYHFRVDGLNSYGNSTGEDLSFTTPNNVATLTNLVISNGTVSPAFSNSRYTYAASVPVSASSITLTPTATDSTATIAINGTQVTNGSASPALALATGANSFSVVVTAQDGLTTQTYTVIVTRQSAPPATLDFDDLTAGSGGSSMPSSYGGLNWSNFEVFNPSTYSYLSGYQNAVVSSSNVIFNSSGNPADITIASGTFNLVSLYVGAAWFDGLNVQFTGYNGSTQTYSQTVVANTQGPTYVLLNFNNVTRVNVSTSGGTSAGFNFAVPQCVIDNLTYTSVASGIGAWRYTWFNTTANTGNAADTADPNGDGVVNLLEYALNGNPVSYTSGSVTLPQASVGAGGTLQLVFNRYLDRNDLIMSVQAADSPSGPWTNLAQSVNGAAFSSLVSGTSLQETGTGNVRTVTAGDLYQMTDPSHPRRFMRLQVAGP